MQTISFRLIVKRLIKSQDQRFRNRIRRMIKSND